MNFKHNFFFLRQLIFLRRSVPKEIKLHLRQGKKGQWIIDLGANIGASTQFFLDRGFKVLAVEPNPWAAEKLRERFSKDNRVEILQAAVGSSDLESVDLYLHEREKENPGLWSTGSSLISSKQNVSEVSKVAVAQVNINGLLEKFTDVFAVKMDIEGAELDVIRKISSQPKALGLCSAIFIERHDFIGVSETTSAISSLRKEAGKKLKIFENWP